jgi:hypothetical protein
VHVFFSVSWKLAPAGLILAAWGICAVSLAVEGVGRGVLGVTPYLVVAALLTAWVVLLITRAGGDKASALAALPPSILAAASILFAALSLGLHD